MDNKSTLKQLLSISNASSSVKFPLEAFPAGIQYIIQATNKSLCYPIDFMGAAVLYALGLAIGNTHKVQVKGEYLESANLYMAVVGQPGTVKSHPLSFTLKPFYQHDEASLRGYKVKKQEYEQHKEMSKADRIKEGIAEPVKPAWQKHLVQDFTPEALLEVHQFNTRGIGVYMDELIGFFKNFNRYASGSDQEFWLSAWSGKPIVQDRKSGEPLMISQPFIPIIGTIQEGLLKSLAKDNRNQNGFMDRILFAFPEGLKKEYWSNTDLCPTIAEDWERYLLNLLERPLPVDENLCPAPIILKYTPEAFQLLDQWQQYNTDLVNDAPIESLAGLYTKLENYCSRLSLILQMAAYATGEADRKYVEVAAVKGAILLTEYFRHTGTRVHDMINNYNAFGNMPENKRRLYDALPHAFTTKEGLEIADDFKMPERTFKYFLNDESLFKRLNRGMIQKLF